MLADVHLLLTQLLYTYGQISADEVDVRFEMPTKDWIASLTRPTVDLYLFDVQENKDLRQTMMRTTRADGKGFHRMPPRRFDLSYMVSAPTTDVGDEHMLLWRVLATLMKHEHFPPDVLPESLRSVDPPLRTRILGTDEGPRLLDLWSALETPPHPALLYVVTAPLDLEIEIQSPLVLTRTARYLQMHGDVPPDVGIHIGGVIRDRQGQPVAGVSVTLAGRAVEGAVTNAEGEFVLRRVPAGPVTLRVLRGEDAPRLVNIDVPSNSYEITLD